MSAVLGIDTATPAVAVAVCEDGVALACHHPEPAQATPRHGIELMAAIEASIAEAGGWDRISRIAVGIGPGGFTGLRIGVATARALALARGVEIVGVSSTAALAAPVLRAGAKRVAAILDARRGEVFAALYERADQPRWGPEAIPPEALANRFAERGLEVVGVGDGSVRFRDELASLEQMTIPPDSDRWHRLDARETCALAIGAEPEPAVDVRPFYARLPDAKRWRDRDGVSDGDQG